MPITIADSVQYTPNRDGLVPREFKSVSVHQDGYASSPSTAATQLSVSGTLVFTDQTSDTAVLLVPELRPFRCAALHVVGKSFVDAIPLDDRRIRRFK